MITIQASQSRVALASLLAIALLASSCSILPKREPVTIYQPLRAASAPSPEWPRASWTLLVSRPVAGTQVDSERINVQPAPGTVQVYKGAAWTDAAPDLLQMSLLKGFEDSQRILSVARSGGGVRGEYQLLTELRRFESEYTQPGQAQATIEVYARLVHTADGRVVAAQSFKGSEPAASEEIAAVVDALSRVLDRTTGEIVGWTLRSGNEVPAHSH